MRAAVLEWSSVYSAKLLDHFRNPRHSGELPDADVRVQIENPACGDVMELALRLEGDRVVACRFRTRGCVAAIACGSALMSLIDGKSLATLRNLRLEEIAEVVGGLPPASEHASHLAIDALQAALTKLGR